MVHNCPLEATADACGATFPGGKAPCLEALAASAILYAASHDQLAGVCAGSASARGSVSG